VVVLFVTLAKSSAAQQTIKAGAAQ